MSVFAAINKGYEESVRFAYCVLISAYDRVEHSSHVMSLKRSIKLKYLILSWPDTDIDKYIENVETCKL